MPLIPRPAGLLAVWLTLFAALAAAELLGQRSPWQTFGTFEITWADTEGPHTIRMIRFANSEFMAESEANGVKKQYLEVQPSGLVLYSGLRGDESPGVGGTNPFMFFDYGFAYPAMALHEAYPSGAGAVPEARTDKQVVLENKHPANLTTVRDAANRVRFRLVLTSEVKMTMDGTWDGQLREPLPNDLPVSAWRHTASAVVADLGQARALSKEQARPK